MKKVLNILRQIVGWIVVVLMAFSTFGSFLNKGYLSAILFMLVAIFNVPQIQTIVFKFLGKIIKQDKKAKKIIIILALHLVALIICFTAIFSLPSSENVDTSDSKAETTSVSQKTTTKKEKVTETTTKKENKKPKPEKKSTVPETTTDPKDVIHTEITFDELYKEYKLNEVRAEDKYDGKKFRITARINNIEADGLLNLTGGATLTMEKKVGNTIVFFYAEFEREQEEKLKKVNVGDTVTFVGVCYGGSFSDCELE